MKELKSNKKSLESQKKIYKGLRQILLYKPLKDVTISDIKKECNISRSTFYRNFNNVVDVLDVMMDYYYNRYLIQRKSQENQLLFFFEYWGKHKDLISIFVNQNETGLKKCLLRHNNDLDDPYILELHYHLFICFLTKWSLSKKETPEQMEQIVKKVLNKKCLDLLIDEENQKPDYITYASI